MPVQFRSFALIELIAPSWKIGEYWVVALVLKTSPYKSGEGSIPLSSATFLKISINNLDEFNLFCRTDAIQFAVV